MKSSRRIPGKLKLASGKTGRYAVLLMLLSPVAASAQRQRTNTNGFWLCYFVSTRLNKRYSVQVETEMHTRQWASRWAEQVLDINLANKLNERWRVAAGTAWYRSAQYLDVFFFKNEWRLWQEAGYSLHGEKLSFSQRLRIEERWLQQLNNGKKIDSYSYITRFRYRTELQKPLWHGKITPVFGNEFMFNPGYWNSNHFLDQNRSWAGVNFKVANATSLQAHYLKIFQWRTDNTLDNQNIFRLNIVQQFNLKH